MNMFEKSINAIDRSRVCARDFLNKSVPKDIIQHLLKIASSGPRKDGQRYFDLYAITNKELIKKLWHTSSRPDEQRIAGHIPQFIGNTQLTAPLIFVFMTPFESTPGRPRDANDINELKKLQEEDERYQQIALGAASGILVYEANRLGLHTGHCACYSRTQVEEILKDYNQTPDDHRIDLMIGVGYPHVSEWGQEALYRMRHYEIPESGEMYDFNTDDEVDYPNTFMIE